MSAVSGQPAAAAPSLRRLPFTVNVAPPFTNPFIGAPSHEPSFFDGSCGLLFGIRDSGSVLVKRSYPFDLREANGTEGHWFESGVVAAQRETEFQALSPVGWYVQRSAGGLLESDIEIHNRHFPKATDLAMVVRPEGSNEIICEIYSRSVEGLLSEEGHRWGLLRLTRQKLLEAPAEVTMRSQMRDDFFMRAYNEPYETNSEAAPAIWRRALDRLRRKTNEQNVAREPQADPGLAIPAKKPQPGYDPSDDATREMPRELALKALGLDMKVEAPASMMKTATPPALTRPAREAVLPENLQPITAERPRQSGRGRVSLWISAAAIFGFAAAATFTVIHYRLVPATFVSTTGTSSPLGLRLEGQGDRILVSWNRKGDAALAAIHGQLAIDDGGQHKELTLDATQIVTGSVLYRPVSADITFRLRMTDGGGKQLEETLRVLDASRTNNDGIKVITVDGTAAALPPLVPKAPAARKTMGRVAPVTVAVGAEGDANAPAPDVPRNAVTPGEAPSHSELPPSSSSGIPLETPKKEAPAATEPEKVPATTGAAPSVAETEDVSETVLPPPPAASERAVVASPVNPLRNYYPPKPARQVMPNLRALPPGLATANAQVEVTVSIDGQGRVLAARVTNATGKASSALSAAALMAARGWTFSPATMNGQAVASEHAIVFNFKPASR